MLQCGSPDSLCSHLWQRKTLGPLFTHPGSLGKLVACSSGPLLRVPFAFFQMLKWETFFCWWSPSTSLQACFEVPLCSQGETPVFQSYLNKTLDFALLFFLFVFNGLAAKLKRSAPSRNQHVDSTILQTQSVSPPQVPDVLTQSSAPDPPTPAG